jgi:hypothetical protein
MTVSMLLCTGVKIGKDTDMWKGWEINRKNRDRGKGTEGIKKRKRDKNMKEIVSI